MKRNLKSALALVLAFCLGALLFGGVQAIAAAIEASPSTAKVQIDGEEVQMEAYNIAGNNYFKLRDLAAALDIGLWWEEEARTIHLETYEWYDPDYTGPASSELVACTIGQEYQTKWFSFQVHSIDKVASYTGYSPEAGFVLYDVLLSITNTYEQSQPFGTYDWYMDEVDWPSYIYPLDPLGEEMMPDDFELAAGQTAQYHMLFEVPDEKQGLQLIYQETDYNDNLYNTYVIQIN